MKTFFFSLLLLPLFSHAVSEFELERLERSCRLQQESLLKQRNGTPACSELKQAKKEYARQQRAQRAADQKQQAAQAKADKATQKRKNNPQAIANGQGSGYRWNSHENRYCQHNQHAIPIECY